MHSFMSMIDIFTSCMLLNKLDWHDFTYIIVEGDESKV